MFCLKRGVILLDLKIGLGREWRDRGDDPAANGGQYIGVALII